MRDSQKKGSSLPSGGQRIDDHSSWIGAGNSESVFPRGVKVKNESSADSAGNLSRYEDTSEAIKEVQNKGQAQVKRHPMKPGSRY